MTVLMSYFNSPISGEWGGEADDSTNGVPVLRTTNFTEDGRLSYDDLTYRFIDTEKKKKKILQPGDIIIEKSGGTPKKPVGRCVYFEREDGKQYFCNNFTAILRANTDEVNTKYLWYLLQERYRTRQCLKYQYKTNGIANLDIKDYLSHIEVDLPPKEVQDRRVKALDYIQHLLDLHKKLLEILDYAVKSQFIEMFGSEKDNTKKYPIQKIGDFSECYPGATPSTKKKEYWEGGKIPWMSSGEVYKEHIYDTEQKITDSGYKNASTKMVPPHSIVIALAGQGRTRGTVAINEIELCTNQSLCAVIPNNNVVLTDYLFQDLKNRYEELREMSTVPGGRGGLSLTIINKVPVLVPPLERQQAYVDMIHKSDKSKSTIQRSLDNLSELREGLLQEYFG